MAVATYTVEIPVTSLARSPAWHERAVEEKILAFDPANPLGVTSCVDWIVCLYFPTLVMVAGTLNIFALCVLQSHFLRNFVIQPLLTTYLHLHNLLLIVGPFYIWLVQCHKSYLTQNQVYPCFLLLWTHNFTIMATSFVLVAMVLERALSVSRPEILWDIWQAACRNITCLMLIGALVLAVGGLMCVDRNMEKENMLYPICVPWWDNEHASVSPIWYKMIATSFSLGPCITLLLAMMLLMISVARFKLVMRSAMETLNHYNALYMEIKAILHMKFVKSVFWLGTLFICFSAPLGVFIVLGPAVHARMTGYGGNKGESAGAYQRASEDSENVSLPIDTENVEDDGLVLGLSTSGWSNLSVLEHSYLLVSRTDTETILWGTYYFFSTLVVPVLLGTEILFRREWNGQLKKLLRTIYCRTGRASRLPTYDTKEEGKKETLAGPYIAKSDERLGTTTLLRSLEEAKSIKIYDASKAERVGRLLQCCQSSGAQLKNAGNTKKMAATSGPSPLQAVAEKPETDGPPPLSAADGALMRSMMLSKNAAVTTALAAAVPQGRAKSPTLKRKEIQQSDQVQHHCNHTAV